MPTNIEIHSEKLRKLKQNLQKKIFFLAPMKLKKILIPGSNGLLGQKLIDLYLDNKDIEFIATAKGKNASSYSTRICIHIT